MTKVKVIVLSSGENEVDQCLDAVRQQQGVEFSLQRIKDLPNREAHEQLYRSIEQSSGDFDYFVKVDGDMVFTSEFKLSGMIRLVQEQGLDHAVFSVLDWYSQSAIMGMHVFSNRCSWPDLGDPLFVDPQPCFPGDSILVWDSPSPVAYHSPDPSLSQAIQFGYHRGLKIVQRDRSDMSLDRSLFHYELMKKIYSQLLLAPDVRRQAALYGVEAAFKSSESHFEGRGGDYVSASTQRFQHLSEARLNGMLDYRWGKRCYGASTWFDFTFFRIWLRYIFAAVKRKFRRLY